MEHLHERIWTPYTDLEIRGDGRTVYGLAVPFDQETRVNDGFGAYREVFKFGSFAKTIAERGGRVKLMINHDRQRLPIGKATMLREDPAGLIGEFHVSNTREGDEALELVSDGVLDAFSIGFAPVKERKPERDLVERLEVKLREVSVVAFPAYEGALIGGVRTSEPEAADDGTSDVEAAASDTEPGVSPTRGLDRLLVARRRRDIAQIMKGISQ